MTLQRFVTSILSACLFCLIQAAAAGEARISFDVYRCKRPLSETAAIAQSGFQAWMDQLSHTGVGPISPNAKNIIAQTLQINGRVDLKEEYQTDPGETVVIDGAIAVLDNRTVSIDLSRVGLVKTFPQSRQQQSDVTSTNFALSPEKFQLIKTTGLNVDDAIAIELIVVVRCQQVID
jgi:hypothetical protein